MMSIASFSEVLSPKFIILVCLFASMFLNAVHSKKEKKDCQPHIVAIKKTKVIPVAVPVKSNKSVYRIKLPAPAPQPAPHPKVIIVPVPQPQ